MLDAALAFAARGWPVFPCHANDKRPLVGESSPDAGDAGLYRATCDVDTITAWWKKWPQAMIGVPTGAPIGAFVIDIDPKDGGTVDQVLASIEAAIGEPLPDCPRVQTPRGGLHLYLAMPAGVEIGNRANVIPHVDVRGTGGYVIVPPSVRRGAKAKKEGCDGNAYGRLSKGKPPPPSAVIVHFVTEYRHGDEVRARAKAPSAPRPHSQGRAPVSRDEAVINYALSALHAEVEAVATMGEGGRNDRLNRAAYALGQLVGAGALEEHDAIAGLEAAAERCGLFREDGARSVRATIASGLKGGIAQPRDLSSIGSRPEAPSQRSARGSQGQPAKGRTNGSSSNDGAVGDGPNPAVLQACAKEPQNDTGNARRLRHLFGHDLLNVREVGEHAWTGTHWEPEGAAEAFIRFAQATAESIAVEADHLFPTPSERRVLDDAEPITARPQDELNDGQRELLKAARAAMERVGKRREGRRKFAISSGNTSRINGMLAQASPHLTVGPQEMDTEPLAINVLNGTLRLVSREVEVIEDLEPVEGAPNVPWSTKRKIWEVRLDPHDRADRISKVMPVVYDPLGECPKWFDFMIKFQPKSSVRNFLRMFHGYALTALMGEQVFVYNYGLGANGKSTFMETLARLMGPYAQMLPSEAITGDLQRRGDQATPEFARLPGARLVRCAELERGQRFKESVLKMLTGGEPILVRHLHARFFEFSPTFKAIGSGNDRPPIGGVDEGIWRRMNLVPWEVTIPAPERRPMAKVLAEFEAEGSGILNWLLVGLIDYLENGWRVPAEVQAATDSYRSDMDPVGEFCASCVVPSSDDTITAREMYQAYVAWAHANSVKPFAEKTFAQIMVQKGFEKSMGRIRTYQNVRLEGVPEDPDLPKSADTGSRYYSD
jgi:putative DNA primase/helicase